MRQRIYPGIIHFSIIQAIFTLLRIRIYTNYTPHLPARGSWTMSKSLLYITVV